MTKAEHAGSVADLDTETRRMAAVTRYVVLDTARNRNFDTIAGAAARHLDCPIGFVSIVDADRIWYKATVGLGDLRQTVREPGLCASAILQDDPYVVANTGADHRATGNTLVRERRICFYAAAPIVAPDGSRLGTVGVMDHRPRHPSEEQLGGLRDLADRAMEQLELRRSVLDTLRGGGALSVRSAGAPTSAASLAGQEHPMVVQVDGTAGAERRVSVSGNVDADSAEHLSRQLVRAIPEAPEAPEVGASAFGLVVDLSGVRHFGAAAFAALRSTQDRLEQLGGRLRLSRVPPAVRRALSGMDPSGRLPVEPDGTKIDGQQGS